MRQSPGACTALLLFLTATGVAQQKPRSTGLEDRPVGKSAITRDESGGLIHLDAVVTDSTGQRVSGLCLEDFTLLDNGQPEKILSFSAADETSMGPGTPSRLILVIDVIDLMFFHVPQEIIRDESVAVQHYLRRNGGQFTRPVSVYLIDDRGLWTVAHPDGDGNAMADDIVHDQLKLIRRFGERPSTEINGGITPHDTPAMSTLKSIGQIATEERRKPGRKVMVWVGPRWAGGPGLYNAYRTKQDPLDTRVWLSTLMREARIALYSFAVAERDPRIGGILAVEWNGNRLAPPASTYMSWDREELALQSGGLAMRASDDIVRQIESCVRDADTFYTLTFDPSYAAAPNEFHDLKVLMKKPGLTARTNEGYYDQPWYAVDRYPAAELVTVKQLEQSLTASCSTSDAECARQLADLELSERLSETKAPALAARRGKRTREALRILADASAFLDPPPDEIVNIVPPDADAQRRMLALTAEYLSTTIHKLPNYLARQTTMRYQETPTLAKGRVGTVTQPLHLTDTLSATVFYRNGTEVVVPRKPKGRRKDASEPQLATYGTFGPVLAGALEAIQRHADLAWSRWEQSAAGPLAVFHYTVPAETSRYEAKACCLPDGDGHSAFLHYVGYHGEIAVDPQTGTILRLEWSADLKSTTPVAQSRIMIKYGPVDIGGTKYICPVRSISMMRARSVMQDSDWDESFLTYGPYATMLNEIEFTNYHLFRSTARILPDFIPAPKDQ